MNIAQEIQKLHDLKQAGAITEADYIKAKESLLSIAHIPDQPQSTNPLDSLTSNTNTYCMLLHLSQLLNFIPMAGLIAPIILWQLKKDDPIVDNHGRTALNWIITEIILFILCFPLMYILIGIPFFFILVALSVVFPIIAAIKANDGIHWKYPMSFNFFYVPEFSNIPPHIPSSTPPPSNEHPPTPTHTPPHEDSPHNHTTDDQPEDRINSKYD